MQTSGARQRNEFPAPSTAALALDLQRDNANPAEPIYILVTQCLQNDFFLNLNCRLVLPKDAAGKLLIHRASEEGFNERGSRRTISARTVQHSPLSRLLASTVGKRCRGEGQGTLHLVNIRDWHIESEAYDRERFVYGSHCEPGTWGAEYVDHVAGLLDPTGTSREVSDEKRVSSRLNLEGIKCGKVVVHHVHSNTLFDLDSLAYTREQSELAQVLQNIITQENRDRVRVAVIGVYTDIKIQIILQSLRVAYNPKHLVVSDSLTASPTLERHLAALDFAQKVLGVEVMHSIGDLVRFLGSDPGEDEELESSANDVEFADYAEYFRDKQSILSNEDTQMRSYRQEITGRLRQTVRLVNFTSYFLIGCGILTLGSTVILATITAIHPGRLPVVLPAVLLGLSVVQLVSVFFSRPAEELTRMLSQEAVVRMLLQSRSLRLALARYHLTTAQALHSQAGYEHSAKILQEHMDLLMNMDKTDFDRFDSFGGAGRSRNKGRSGNRKNRVV